jgi:hypothetical protein
MGRVCQTGESLISIHFLAISLVKWGLDQKCKLFVSRDPEILPTIIL